MLRRLGLVFMFFGIMSAAYATESNEKVPESCNYGCIGRCGMSGGELEVCRYICGC